MYNVNIMKNAGLFLWSINQNNTDGLQPLFTTWKSTTLHPILIRPRHTKCGVQRYQTWETPFYCVCCQAFRALIGRFPVDDTIEVPSSHVLSKEDLTKLNTEGYLVIDNFLGAEKQQMYHQAAKNLYHNGKLRLAKMGDDKWYATQS